MESVEGHQTMIFNDKRGNLRNIERFELLAFCRTTVIVVCYHSATRTGQTSPIRPHVESILCCGWLWG